MTEADEAAALEAEERALIDEMNKLTRKARETRAEKAAKKKIEKALAAGKKGTAIQVADEEIKRLRGQMRLMKDTIKFKKTARTTRVIVPAGQRPAEKREVVLVLTRNELRKIVHTLQVHDRFMAHAQDRPLRPSKIDADIGKGDLDAYIIKCAVLANVAFRLQEHEILAGELGPYAFLNNRYEEEWPDDETA